MAVILIALAIAAAAIYLIGGSGTDFTPSH
jgi:hypothetical protein